MVDRFSDLEEGIAHHILSFLNIRQLTRFSSVSKRCRELSLSTPSLNFEDFLDLRTSEYFFFFEVPCEVRLDLLNSLDRFLLRRGDNRIQYFYLRWDSHFVSDSYDNYMPCFCINEHFRIISWVHYAVRCNVEVLHVENDITFQEGLLTFPFCVFLCPTLRSLLVNINQTIVKTPSFAFSSNLEYLEFINVDIEDEEVFKWISCSCKFLKELSLWDVHKIKNITIQSSSLERFYISDTMGATCHLNISGQKLETISIEWRFYSPSNISLNISAPNLKYLVWSGNLMNHANLGKLEFLKYASICMHPEVNDSNNLFEIFCGLNTVGSLVLNDATIKALYREGSKHALLDSLFYLRMNIRSFYDELVPAVVSLLRGLPNLYTLYIGYYRPRFCDPKFDASGFDMEYWKLQDLDFIYKLKKVIIELSSGSNGIEFARYVLEHAETLRKMVIIYLPDQSDVIQKLNESKMMSKAIVIFQEKEAR